MIKRYHFYSIAHASTGFEFEFWCLTSLSAIFQLSTASDKDDQLLAQAWWFSPGTLPSSTTKIGCHDIAEILLKVMLNTKIQIQTWKMKREKKLFCYIK
jgi:hypothetical protein